MIGTVTETHLSQVYTRTAGGWIRTPEYLERVPFESSQLIGLSLGDALGQEVFFDVQQVGSVNRAVRVRPAR